MAESERPVVPMQLAGQWIAWDHKREKIIASGRTFGETRQAALEQGEEKPYLAKAPRADIRSVSKSLQR